MSTQHRLTVGQARTIRQNGMAEFVAHDASIQPERHTFANLDERTAYLGKVLSGRPEGGGIRGPCPAKAGPVPQRCTHGVPLTVPRRQKMPAALELCPPTICAHADKWDGGCKIIVGIKIPLRKVIMQTSDKGSSDQHSDTEKASLHRAAKTEIPPAKGMHKGASDHPAGYHGRREVESPSSLGA